MTVFLFVVLFKVLAFARGSEIYFYQVCISLVLWQSFFTRILYNHLSARDNRKRFNYFAY